MGKYVDGSLLPGEDVIVEGRPHWAMFVAPGIVTVFGLLMVSATKILFIVGLLWLGFRYLVYASTELALTNKRVIAKSGIIRRNFIDVSLSKVEGVMFHQGILGRVLGYGSIGVRGTGTGHVPVPFIEKPEAFKQEVGRMLHAG